MRPKDGVRLADIISLLGALVLVAGVVLVLATDASVAPLRFFVLVVGGVAALVGAWLWRREGAGRDASVAAAEERAAKADGRAREAERRAGIAEDRGRRSDEARLRAERARAIEREWNRELRDQIGRLYRERRSLTETGDVRELVLRTALTLVEAEKGVLLAVGEGEGDLELVADHGFDGDPRESSTVRRFAREADDRDRIVHDDAPDDEEIDNLVAIPVRIGDDFAGVAVCANADRGFADHDDELLLALGAHAGAALDSARLHAELRSAYLGTVRMLAEAIEAKDASLRGHSEDVAGSALAVGERLGLDGARRETLLFGSLLHDVGKIGIAEAILAKPGALTADERRVVEQHPRIGVRLVEQVPALKDVGPCVLHHHERFDGQGYPTGLRGEEIPLEARIVAVVDAFAAMTADRPYRAAMDVETACAELARCAGTQFDPEVVGLFVEEIGRRGQRSPGALRRALADPELAARSRDGNGGLVGATTAALVDPLTMLPSRRYFDEVLAAEVERAALHAEPFAVVLVELAGLDHLNRTGGLAAGDAALLAAARAVADAAGGAGGRCYRFSGRRFGVLFPAGGRATAEVLTRLGTALDASLEPRWGAAAWQPGDRPADVLARAGAEASAGAMAVRP